MRSRVRWMWLATLWMACSGTPGAGGDAGPGDAPAATGTPCSGTLTGAIAGDVVVASGASCTIARATIGGGVVVGGGATLVIDGRQYPSVVGGSVTATGCASARLDGAVTVHGDVVIQGCAAGGGFDGPDVAIDGDVQCTGNAGACVASFGTVGGSVHVDGNTAAAPSDVSQSTIGKDLECLDNAAQPGHADGPDRVLGAMTGQCAGGGFAPATPPGCAALATDPAYGLAGNPFIVSPTAAVVAATADDAAYCDVQFTYAAIGDTAYGYAAGEAQAIGIGIGLPLSSADGGAGGSTEGAWNGRIQNLGGGKLVGSVGSTVIATDDGFVGSSTDGGHTIADDGNGIFGVIQATHELDRGKIIDYEIESIHQQVEWAKLLAVNYYGTAPLRNYWDGCSTGGRQGLALARFYGGEFDGFLVGAPAAFFDEFRLSDAWPWLVIKDQLAPLGQTLTVRQYGAAVAAAIASCQAQNGSGLPDGYLDDPRRCQFDAVANVCGAPGAPAAPACLTPQEAQAVDQIWDGARNHLGQRIWHPFERGNPIEVGFATIPEGAQQVIAWDHRDLDFDDDLLFSSAAAAAAAGSPPGAVVYEDEAVLGAGNTADLMDETNDQAGMIDLAQQHGAKVLLWQGTADPLIRWRDSVDFYRRAAVHYSANGTADFANLQSWFRYYHAPGAAHCGETGPGPSPILAKASAPGSIFGALVAWVETGAAPATLVSHGGTVSPDRTRPLCPWPTTAIYDGTGDPEVAASFHCGGDLDADLAAACTLLRATYKLEGTGPLDGAATGLDPAACAAL